MKPKRRKSSAKPSSDERPAAILAVVSTEEPEKEQLPAMDKISQGLKFVDVTPRYFQGSWTPAEQKSIRIHVMKDFLRQKRQAVDVVEPPVMAGTVSSHVHRFRIAKPRLPGDKSVGIASSQQTTRTSERNYWGTPSRSCSTTLGSPRDVPESEAVVQASANQPSQNISLLAKERASASALRISPNLPGVMARMDPFARLPIDGSVETHEILDYYRTSYRSNSLAVNPDGRWLSITATDPALFHAQLSLVSQHQAMSRRKPFTEQYYYHRGMAMSIVTSRLVHPVEAISDATIGAVALLSNSDVSRISGGPNVRSPIQDEMCARSTRFTMTLLIQTAFQNYLDVPPEAQHSHINGLLSLVQLRGGLHTLSANEPVKRVVTWADLVHAAANDRAPCLGMSKCNAGYDLKQLFPDSAAGPAGASTHTIYSRQPPVPAPLKAVFETIRLLSIAQSSPDTVDLKSTVNRRILANVLYRVEYLLLDPLLLPLGVSKGQKDSKELNYSDFWTPLFSATTAGALIFTYSCLRNLAIHSRPFQSLVTRLRRNLQLLFDGEESTRGTIEEGHPSLDQKKHSPPPVSTNPPLLLWLLLHGFKATLLDRRDSNQEWFVRRGAELCKNCDIQSLEELRMQIKQVVALRPQCVAATEVFWNAICGHQEKENSCMSDN